MASASTVRSVMRFGAAAWIGALRNRSVEQSDGDRLRFYLKSQDNRDRYSEEIWALLRKDPSLLPVYHQELGKFANSMLSKISREVTRWQVAMLSP